MPCDQCVGNVGMTVFPALFEPFSRTKKKAAGYEFVKGKTGDLSLSLLDKNASP